MYLDSVCIYDSVVTTHRRKIKTRFAFFDEVFHQTSFAVKFDEIFRWGIHICDDKGIHVNHLVFWLLNLAHNASFIRPWTSFVHEFTVNHSVVYLVILSPTGKCICKKRRFFTENLVFLQPDNIVCSVFLTLLIEIRSCKTTIAAKQEMDGWIIIQVLIENRLQEIGYTGAGISRSITEWIFIRSPVIPS